MPTYFGLAVFFFLWFLDAQFHKKLCLLKFSFSEQTKKVKGDDGEFGFCQGNRACLLFILHDFLYLPKMHDKIV